MGRGWLVGCSGACMQTLALVIPSNLQVRSTVLSQVYSKRTPPTPTPTLAAFLPYTCKLTVCSTRTCFISSFDLNEIVYCSHCPLFAPCRTKNAPSPGTSWFKKGAGRCGEKEVKKKDVLFPLTYFLYSLSIFVLPWCAHPCRSRLSSSRTRLHHSVRPSRFHAKKPQP